MAYGSCEGGGAAIRGEYKVGDSIDLDSNFPRFKTT